MTRRTTWALMIIGLIIFWASAIALGIDIARHISVAWIP